MLGAYKTYGRDEKYLKFLFEKTCKEVATWNSVSWKNK
jgi:hypothetical protein